MIDILEALKAEIESRKKARAIECVNTDSHEKLLRVQGAARELEQLSGFVEQIENPQKMGED